jgi:hypothetical protein
MLPSFDDMMDRSGGRPAPLELGRSREGRAVHGYRFGTGDARVSLLAGCHADEPVGPRLLERVAGYLAGRPAADPIVANLSWWVVPHVNPDGAVRNAAWSDGAEDVFDPVACLRHVVRELPGDDIEFGFPRDESDAGARPENAAVYQWWQTDPTPFLLHASLHGMAVAGGPWFLVEPAWVGRCGEFETLCRDAVERLGYSLHDVERSGEKGFHRVSRGFCTRPDSGAMARFFVERGDEDTARLFRPSSMETIRSFGGDALTLVSEMPLFILPGVGEQIVPADPVADDWRERLAAWRERLGEGDRAVAGEIAASGLRAMPIRDQMVLQWEMIRAGLDQALDAC